MKSDRKRELSRLINREHIHFHELEGVRPGPHAQVFTAIRKLGRYQFENYSPHFTHDAHQKPWRAKLKAQGRRIVHLAEACRREQQNEYGWRLKLEHEIFARFSTEVTCKRCSCRLWRSEVEVLLNPSDSYGDSLDLERRQSMRRPCTCKDFQRNLDREDSGICRIFHDRADIAVKYQLGDSIAHLLPAEQRPDRVFGYHETSRFANLMNQQLTTLENEGQEIRDILECSPFDEPRDQVLFPFLVLESKCESGDSFDSIEIQTAFSIKKLLDLQYKLKSAAGRDSQWESGPLVWFLSNRGDDWRVAAAYPQQEGPASTLHYHVYQLWNGSLRSMDGSLQLLLIMDYIWDWARDSHREAVLGELRVLAGGVGSDLSDSDIHSLGDRMANGFDVDMEQRVSEGQSREDGPDHSQDSDKIVFRSISNVRARLSALYLTKDTLDPLLSSFASNRAARNHVLDLLRLLVEAWKVCPEALEALEFMWTGKWRDDPDLYGSDRTYYAVFTVKAYFTWDWEHVLELTYIAVAEDALQQLQSFARPQNPIHVCPSEMPTVRQGDLVGWFRFFRQSDPRVRFHAAMRRACFSSRHRREKTIPHYRITAEERIKNGVRLDFETIMLPDSRPKSCQIVTAAYKQCAKGRREPEESFLRISSCFDTTPWDGVRVTSVWDLGDCAVAGAAKQVLLLPTRTGYRDQPDFCIYLMDDVPDPQAFLIETSGFSMSAFQLQECHPSSKIWNVKLDDPFDLATSPLLDEFRTEYEALQYARATPRAERTMPRSTYHATKELPAHFRNNTGRYPCGRWVMYSTTPGTNNERIRAATEYAEMLVASRNVVKTITYLYSQPNVTSRNGLRAETKSPARRGRREDLRGQKLEDFKIQGIAQKGDSLEPFRNSTKRRFEQSSRDETAVATVMAGDWLSDVEIEALVKAGEFDGDAFPSNPVSARVFGLDDEDRAQEVGRESKRARLEASSSGAGERAESSASARYHVADDELEQAFEGGYFDKEV